MKKEITLGKLLRIIRKRMDLNMREMAFVLDSAEYRVNKLELGRAVVTVEERDAYRALALTVWECKKLNELFVPGSSERDRIACDDCGMHDAEMRPGGKLGFVHEDKATMGDRDELCDNIKFCLDEFIQRWPNAQRSHCPTNCSKRAHTESERLVSIGSSANVNR